MSAQVQQVDHISKHPHYGRWKTMNKMCSNPNSREFSKYGGAGVKVDPEWSSGNKDGSSNFIQWVDDKLRENPKLLENDYLVIRKGFQGDFSPENCDVVTREEVRKNISAKKAK